MTKNVSIAGQKISIEITNHFLKRITERNITVNNLALTENIIHNILNSEYKKTIVKYLLHNIAIVIKKDSPVRIAFVTCFTGLECNSDNANVITLH